MDHHLSFPAQHRRDLKPCRRDLKMAYLLFLLTLLLLTLLPVMSSGNAESPPSKDSSGSDEFQGAIVIVSPFSAPDEKRKKNEVEHSKTRAKGLHVITVRCADTREPSSENPSKNAPSGLFNQCYSTVESELKRLSSWRLVFDVYDLEKLKMLQKNLALKYPVSHFYVRCMPKTYYDDPKTACRGGPERPLDPDRYIKDGYYKNGADRVQISREDMDDVYYYGDVDWWIDSNKVREITNKKVGAFSLNGTDVKIVKESGKIHLVDGFGNREGDPRQQDVESLEILSADDSAVVKVQPNNETFPFNINDYFKDGKKKLNIKLEQTHYLTPFSADKIRAGPRTLTYVVDFSSFLSKSTRSIGTNFTTIRCSGEGDLQAAERCAADVWKKLKRYGKTRDFAVYVLSTDLSTLEAFAHELADYRRRNPDVFPDVATDIFPNLFLLKKKAPFFQRKWKGIRGLASKAGEKLRTLVSKKHKQKVIDAENRKTIGDFHLATFSSAAAFGGSMATSFDYYGNRRVCWDFFVRYTPMDWKITVDGKDLVGQIHVKTLDRVFLRWAFGAFTTDKTWERLSKRQKRIPQPEGVSSFELKLREGQEPWEFEIKCSNFMKSFNGNDPGELRFNLIRTVIATNRLSEDQWLSEWKKQPVLKPVIHFMEENKMRPFFMFSQSQ